MPSALDRCGLLQRCLGRLGRVTLPLEGEGIQRMPCPGDCALWRDVGAWREVSPFNISLSSVDPEARADGNAADAASVAAAADVGVGP